MSEVVQKSKLAKQAAQTMGNLTTEQKNAALLLMADSPVTEQQAIIEANAKDLQRGKELGTSASLLDRLALNESRIAAIAEGLRQIAELPDPVGDTLGSHLIVQTVCAFAKSVCPLVWSALYMKQDLT